MKRIVTQEEMKDIEYQTYEKFFLSETSIIEDVGIRVADKIIELYLKDNPNVMFVFLIGKGNNGADGLAIGRHLANKGYDVFGFYLFQQSQWSDELTLQMKRAEAFGMKLAYLDSVEELKAFFDQTSSPIIVVDALFGTGVRLPLSNLVYDTIALVNNNNSSMISIDIPSGVEGNTGHIQGNAIKADITFAIGLAKLGSFVSDGAEHCGKVVVIPVGFPQSLLEEGNKFQLELTDIAQTSKSRSKFSDKKNFGHTMVIGGSHGLTGALVLCSQAALKVGTGLVTAATWEAQYQEFLSRLIPEVMTGYIPADENKWGKVLQGFEKYNSLVIGPGLGRSARSRRVMLTMVSNFNGPIVLDADAINVINLSEDHLLFQQRVAPTILTPHFGEFARLMGVEQEQVKQKPLELLKSCVAKLNSIIVLKGPCTYVAFPSGNIYFNLSPNDGMATGGTGDVLAGILGGLLSQDSLIKKDSLAMARVQLEKTISLAILVHSRAGHFAAKKIGVRAMLASSLIEFLPEAFSEFEKHI